MQGTVGFLNCLGQKIGDENEKVLGDYPWDYFDTDDFKHNHYVQWRENQIKSFFTAACPAPDFSQDLVTMIQNNQYQMPTVVQQLASKFDHFFWEIYGSRRLANCFLDYLLQKFLSYIQACSGDAMPSTKQLNPIPLPKQGADDSKIKANLDNYLKAYLQLRLPQCAADRTSIIKKMTQESDADVCQCTNSFVSTNCQSSYNQACPQVNQCIFKLIDDPGKIINFDELKAKLLDCTDQQVQGEPGYVDHSTVAIEGLDMADKFKQLNTDPNALKKFGAWVQDILRTVFKADFCSTCHA